MTRQAVECQACGWRGKREKGNHSRCPRCDKDEVGRARARTRGRPPLPEGQRRVDLHPRVLESTAECLGENPSRMAARLLDAMFDKERSKILKGKR